MEQKYIILIQIQSKWREKVFWRPVSFSCRHTSTVWPQNKTLWPRRMSVTTKQPNSVFNHEQQPATGQLLKPVAWTHDEYKEVTFGERRGPHFKESLRVSNRRSAVVVSYNGNHFQSIITIMIITTMLVTVRIMLIILQMSHESLTFITCIHRKCLM